jgi:ubiquitin-conjugating enzyme E2 J1
MPTKGEGAIGALDYPPQERRRLAKLSSDFHCDVCGRAADLLPELKRGEGGKPAPSKYAEQIAQLHLHSLEPASGAASDGDAAEKETKEAAPAESKEEEKEEETPTSIIGEAISMTREPTERETADETPAPQVDEAAEAREVAAPPPHRPEPIYAAPLPPQPQQPPPGPDHIDTVLHYVTVALTVALFALVYKKMLQIQGVLQ